MVRRADRGAALILALFLMMLLEVLWLAYLRTVYEDLRLTRERVRATCALHCAEGAFEVLAARGGLVGGAQEIAVGNARVCVVAAREGDGWRLEATAIDVRGEGVDWSSASVGVEGILRPGPDGRWRLMVRFH